MYDDDIDLVSNEKAAFGHGGDVGGDGDGGNVGGSDAGHVGRSDVPSNSRVVPLKEEMYTLLMTRSCTNAGFSGFDSMHFYQYMDDHFSHLNLRLDDIDEQQ